MTPRDVFLAKMHRQNAPRRATGSAVSVVTTDLMDKIGVPFPDAHLDADKMASLAEAGFTELGFDNVMPLFSVWHESEAIGCPVDWGRKDSMPTGKPICSSIKQAVEIPDDFLKRPSCDVPLKAIKLLKERIGDEAAIVGKVFGPWTLGYHIYGLETFLMATLLDPDRLKQVMHELLSITVAFAQAQVDSGVDAITLADHCTRDLCSPDTYRDFLAEVHQELHERIGCPLLLHICGDTSDRIEYIRSTGIELFHFDSKVPAVRARELAGDKLALMGGTSNFDVIHHGTREAVVNDVREKLDAGIDIIGPECAVPLDAPWHNLRIMTDAVK